MWSEFQWISVKEVLSRVLRHPMLQHVDLEAGIQYTLDFIGAVGLPNIFEEKCESVEICNFRGMLPCDLVAINQVRNHKTKGAMRYMTDNFNGKSKDVRSFDTWKSQGRIIYTSFPKGTVDVSYKAIKVDDEGFPMLPDNPVFLKALELYIKKEEFTVLFDLGKIQQNVLQNAQTEYAFKVGQATTEFILPSVSEMQSITGMLHQLVPHENQFVKGFKTLGDKEINKVH